MSKISSRWLLKRDDDSSDFISNDDLVAFLINLPNILRKPVKVVKEQEEFEIDYAVFEDEGVRIYLKSE